MDASESQALPPTPRRHWRRRVAGVLAVLMLVAGVCATWSAARARIQRIAVEAILSFENCEVAYDCDPRGVYQPNLDLVACALDGSPLPPPRQEGWTEYLLGKDFVHRAVSAGVTLAKADEALPHLKRLPHLETVYVLVSDGMYDKNLDDKKADATVEGLRQSLPGIDVRGLEFDFNIKDNVESPGLTQTAAPESR